MDNLHPPEELQHLWLDGRLEGRPEKEDTGAVVKRVLRDARNHQRQARMADLACVVAYVLMLPVMLLLVFALRSPYLAASHLVWVVLLLGGLVAYRKYYRSMREEPAPGTTSREYVEYSIDYLNRRERFLVKSATPISVLESIAGILCALAAEGVQGKELDLALAYVVVIFVGQPLGWWLTLHAQGKYSEKRARLRQILADLDT
jgi:hypothetical protein